MIEGLVLWFIETSIGAAIKGFWARFFPSKDEQLGALKQEVKENELTFKEVQERANINQAVDAMPDSAAIIELSKWRAKH